MIFYERPSNMFSALNPLHPNCIHLFQRSALVQVVTGPTLANIVFPKLLNRLVGQNALVAAMAGVAESVTTTTTHLPGD